MNHIVITRTAKCWTATFIRHPRLPLNQPLPLPFTGEAPREMVLSELHRNHPQTIITVAQGS